MNKITAEVEYDAQHGPLIRVSMDYVSVAVYLTTETGIVTTLQGQAGIKVSGPWHSFREGLRILAENS